MKGDEGELETEEETYWDNDGDGGIVGRAEHREPESGDVISWDCEEEETPPTKKVQGLVIRTR